MAKEKDPLSEPTLYFRETQRYNPWWVKFLLAAAFFGLGMRLIYYPMISHDYHAMMDSNAPVSEFPWTLIVISTIFILTIIYFMMRLKLMVEVLEGGVMFRFLLTNRKPRWIPKESIHRFEAVRFGPDQILLDGLLKRVPNQKAYFIEGDIAIRITTKNGNIVQLGTVEPNRFFHALKQIVPDAQFLTETSQRYLSSASDFKEFVKP